MEPSADLAALGALLAELDTPDPEHPDVAVTQDGINTLSVFVDGTIVWENVEEGEPRHLKGVSRDDARRLAEAVASGDLQQVEREAWRGGYP